MAYWQLPPSERTKGKSHVLATACAHADADALLDVAESGGLNVEGLDIHASALKRACMPLARTAAGDSPGITGILDMGWRACRLMVLYCGAVVYERSVPEVSMAKLHQALADDFRLPTSEVDVLLAEADRSEGGEDDEFGLFGQVNARVQAHIGEIAEELRAPFTYAAQQYSGAPVEQLLLVGGGAGIGAPARRLGDVLEIDTRTVAPVDLVECPPRLLTMCSAATLTAAIGLAQFMAPSPATVG